MLLLLLLLLLLSILSMLHWLLSVLSFECQWISLSTHWVVVVIVAFCLFVVVVVFCFCFVSSFIRSLFHPFFLSSSLSVLFRSTVILDNHRSFIYFAKSQAELHEQVLNIYLQEKREIPLRTATRTRQTIIKPHNCGHTTSFFSVIP